MKRFSTSFDVKLPEFRMAFYFGLVQRHRKALRIFSIVFAVSVLYALGTLLGLGTPNPFVFFVGAAYVIWLLVLLGGAERDIRRYMRSPECMIGKEFSLEISNDRHLIIDCKDRNTHSDVLLSRLAMVFEISSEFLVYLDGASVFILPHRALAAGEREMLRDLFEKELGERFLSRFGRKK